MGSKTEQEYMAFRPGDLSSKIEAAANTTGISKSDLVRKAIQMYLDLGPVQPSATYLGAATYFKAVADAAFQAKFFSEDVYDDLCAAIDKSTAPVKKRLEPLFRRLYPGKMTPSEFRSLPDDERQCWMTGDGMVGPEHIERWEAGLEHFGNFADLREARRVLLRCLRGSSPDADLINGKQLSPKKPKERKGK